MKNLEKLSEGGTLAAAIILSSCWLLAVPFIYMLLKAWKKKKNGEKLVTKDAGKGKDTL